MQNTTLLPAPIAVDSCTQTIVEIHDLRVDYGDFTAAVSYTHLTLPTSDLV